MEYPNGARFAFSIIDDTDVATRANVEPVYRLLEDLGMRTSKTVWPVSCPEGSRDFGSSETLDDPGYRDFLVDLKARGFELTWHGATMESSLRDRTVIALDRFREVFGDYPRIHVNHSYNRENLHWGPGRVDIPLLRAVSAWIGGVTADYFQGQVEGSPYWWGDLCSQHIAYCRNLTFNDINTARVNPSIPYRDPARPIVRWWFSSTDAEDADEFAELLHPTNQDRLEREGGVCIVATHLGKGFYDKNRLHPVVEERLRLLARRPGWFPPVGTLLDWMRDRRETELLPPSEWRQMQWRWMVDLATRKARRWLRGRRSARRSLSAAIALR